MLQKVLIANRGEIACRIIRTAERLGIATVAVYSDVDADAVYVQMADEAVHIGPPQASQSYLNIGNIIAAAHQTGADCIHPGYGFLSENADFAAACEEAEITFIGPSAQAMRSLGGKAEAKQIAIRAGVPVISGYQGEAQDLATLQKQANDIGYPIMIKAVLGGGGRGMRLVNDAHAFDDALQSAQREAQASFGDPRVLIEKFITRPRHIEVQVFGDSQGNVVHLFERECTLQRRHQKVVEEAPAPGMSNALRCTMTNAAVSLAKSVGYKGAGTVEFLVEGGNLEPKAAWYFIEMNTRLQVEHPVTEEITGLDLVEWQFRIAAGEELPLEQDDIAYGGHAMEVRLCAEDPSNGFTPAIGKVLAFDMPRNDGLRIESSIGPGSEISPHYDSMIAKIIRVGIDRENVITHLPMDLKEVKVLGVKTNLSFLYNLLNHDNVQSGNIYTGLIGEQLTTLTHTELATGAIAEGARALLCERISQSSILTNADPFDSSDAFQLGGKRTIIQHLLVNDKPCSIELTWMPDHLAVTIDDSQSDIIEWDLANGEIRSQALAMPPYSIVEAGVAYVLSNMQHITITWPAYDVQTLQADEGTNSSTVRAPINGRIVKIMVNDGAFVDKGDNVAVVEAMKMEHLLIAPCAGRIAKIHVAEETQVSQGSLIASIETEETA